MLRMMLGGRSLDSKSISYNLDGIGKTLYLRQDETPQQAITRMTTPTVREITLLAIPNAGSTYDPENATLLGSGPISSMISKVNGQLLIPGKNQTTPTQDAIRRPAISKTVQQSFSDAESQRSNQMNGNWSTTQSNSPNLSGPLAATSQFVQSNGGPKSTVRIYLHGATQLKPGQLSLAMITKLGPRKYFATRPAEEAYMAFVYEGELQAVVNAINWADVTSIDEQERIIHVRPK